MTEAVNLTLCPTVEGFTLEDTSQAENPLRFWPAKCPFGGHFARPEWQGVKLMIVAVSLFKEVRAKKGNQPRFA